MKKKLTIVIGVALLAVCGFIACLFLFPEHILQSIANSERGKAGLETFDVNVKGLNVKYLAGGNGDTILLLHGFGANKDNWTRVAKFLTPHFKVIAPDLIGFGESSRPDGAGYTIMEQMERVKDFADSMNIKEFHLGGSSMGGNISAAFAATHPEYIKSLWLIAPAGVYSSEKSEMAGLLLKGINPLIATDSKSYNGVLEFVFYKKPFIPPPVVKAFAAEAVKNKPINDIVFKAIHDKPVVTDEILKGSEIPTLIVWGKNDRVLHWSGAKIIESSMKNATAQILDKTGHLPMVEKPLETADAFLKFQTDSGFLRIH